jgi:hypothetical protein
LYSLSPHSPQFQQSAGAAPSSLPGWDCNRNPFKLLPNITDRNQDANHQCLDQVGILMWVGVS